MLRGEQSDPGPYCLQYKLHETSTDWGSRRKGAKKRYIQKEKRLNASRKTVNLIFKIKLNTCFRTKTM